MAEYEDREHFIPLRKSDLVELLLRQPGLSEDDRANFSQFCKLVVATYHFEYHEALERLKNAYAPFDPDADTHLLTAPSPEEKKQREDELFKDFGWLMERANFQKLGEEEIEKALEGVAEGGVGVNMDVDLKVFDRWEIFARGDTKHTVRTRKWSRLWKAKESEVEIYKRLVLLFKLRPHKRLGRKIDFSKVYVRIFKDIPKMDLETLIPGAQPQMTWWDKGNIGVPLISGFGAVLVKLMTAGILGTLLAVLFFDLDKLTDLEQALLTGGMGIAILGLIGYAFKSYTSYLNLKNKYEKNLSQSLFYQTLDGNAGTLFRLLDEAEEQECREAILGYYFLWREAGQQGWTSEHLDDYIEEFLEAKAGIKVDFEIDDAIDKLEKLRIVEKLESPSGEVRYRAQSIEKALEMLDYTWDNYFKYNNPEPEEPPIPAQS